MCENATNNAHCVGEMKELRNYGTTFTNFSDTLAIKLGSNCWFSDTFPIINLVDCSGGGSICGHYILPVTNDDVFLKVTSNIGNITVYVHGIVFSDRR